MSEIAMQTIKTESDSPAGKPVTATEKLKLKLALQHAAFISDTYHHEDRSWSTQCAINRSRNRGDRIGSSLAFSYSSIGITCECASEPRLASGQG